MPFISGTTTLVIGHSGALALKGMLEQLATLAEWDTTETLQRLWQEALSDYRMATDAEAQTTALIWMGGPVAALVNGGVRVRCWEWGEAAYWACNNQSNAYRADYRTQEALRLCVTAQSLVMLASHPDEPEETQTALRNQAAGAFMSRGNVWQSRNQFKVAIADCAEAIAIREALCADLEPQGRWETGLRNDLAAAYMNRGNAHYHSEHFLEAVQNWGLAAEIYQKIIYRNWLSGGEHLLAAIFYQLLGYLALE